MLNRAEAANSRNQLMRDRLSATYEQIASDSDVRCVDLNRTSVDEQRSTDWMRFQSLPAFLDPADSSKTIEGYPAPLRATLVARK